VDHRGTWSPRERLGRINYLGGGDGGRKLVLRWHPAAACIICTKKWKAPKHACNMSFFVQKGNREEENLHDMSFHSTSFRATATTMLTALCRLPSKSDYGFVCTTIRVKRYSPRWGLAPTPGYITSRRIPSQYDARNMSIVDKTGQSPKLCER
jgi:hypothetical protein